MKWPFAMRSSVDEAIKSAIGWHCKWVAAMTELQDAEKKADIAHALRRDEQWRRLKAEGQLAYMQDRVVRARDMMLTYVEEPPTMKRKAIPE